MGKRTAQEIIIDVVVQSPSHVQLCDPMDCSTPGLPAPHHFLEFAKFMFIASVVPSSHLILWCPLLLLPSSFPSIRDFSNESSMCIKRPKYWHFSFSISPSMNIQGWFPLRLTGLIPLLSKGLTGVFSSTTVWRHQFFGILPSLKSSSHNFMWQLGRPQPWLDGYLAANNYWTIV